MIMEIKHEIFTRIPPGDRWQEINGDPNRIFPTLTDALEYYFQKTKVRKYHIDAEAGLLYKVVEESAPATPPPSFSIYGED